MLSPVFKQHRQYFLRTALLCSWILVLFYSQSLVASGLNQLNDLSHIQSGTLVFRVTDQTGWQPMPHLSSKINFNINGMLVRATVEQTFRNDSQQWLNTTYIFPLPYQAAVDNLTVTVGKRLIKGKIQPRNKAKHLYQQAKKQGKKAALLQQHKADVFSTDIANIGPGEFVVVRIEYQHLAHYQGGEFSMRMPLVAVPRYKPVPSITPFSDALFPSQKTQMLAEYVPHVSLATSATPVEIQVQLDSGVPLEHIYSPSHHLAIQQLNHRRYQINLDRIAQADRDFVLKWQIQASDIPQSAEFVEYFEQQQYGMLMLLPPEVDQAEAITLPREVVLVIDTSGSMAGQSISQAKQALLAAMDTLNPDDRFNLIAFNSTPTATFPTSVVASALNKSLATQAIMDLQAGGGTEMASALTLAFANQVQDEYLRQVVFVTDGSIDNEEYLFRLIENQRQHSRLYTVGIGSAPNHFFMQQAAQRGKGTFTYISAASEAQQKMQALFALIQQPVLADISASFVAGTEFYPRHIPDLYAGQPLLLLYQSPVAMQDIKLTGKLHQQDWQQSLVTGLGAEQSGLNKLWAKARIQHLSLFANQYAQQQYVQQQITQTGMKHQIVSKYTSLVAIEETVSRPPQAMATDTNIRLPLAKGQQFGRLPQTATSADLQLYLGLLLLLISGFLFTTRKQRHV